MLSYLVVLGRTLSYVAVRCLTLVYASMVSHSFSVFNRTCWFPYVGLLLKSKVLKIKTWIHFLNEIDFEHEHETFLVLIEHFFEFKVFINLKFNGHDGYNGDTAKSMLMNKIECFDVGYLFSNQQTTL